MKCIAAIFAPLLGALGVAVLVGCNTAQITQPAAIDAGTACAERPPILSASCDAGTSAAALVGACAGNLTISVAGLDASSTFPAGMYALGCGATFFTDDHAGGCLDSPACTCASPEAGAGDDAGDAGEGGAAPTAAGVWQCTR